MRRDDGPASNYVPCLLTRVNMEGPNRRSLHQGLFADAERSAWCNKLVVPSAITILLLLDVLACLLTAGLRHMLNGLQPTCLLSLDVASREVLARTGPYGGRAQFVSIQKHGRGNLGGFVWHRLDS